MPRTTRWVSTTTEPGGDSTVTSGAYSDDVRSADLFFDAPSTQSDLYKTTVFILRSVLSLEMWLFLSRGTT